MGVQREIWPLLRSRIPSSSDPFPTTFQKKKGLCLPLFIRAFHSFFPHFGTKNSLHHLLGSFYFPSIPFLPYHGVTTWLSFYSLGLFLYSFVEPWEKWQRKEKNNFSHRIINRCRIKDQVQDSSQIDLPSHLRTFLFFLTMEDSGLIFLSELFGTCLGYLF